MRALENFLALTDAEIAKYLIELASREVLTPLNGKGESFANGTIFVPCSDGHRFGDVYNHHCDHGFHGSNMQMPLASPGGAMLASGDARIETERPYSQHNLLLDIRRSIQLKSCPTVVLYTHMPCALARMLRMDVQTVLTLHAQAEAAVCNDLSASDHFCTTVISCFHIDFAKLYRDFPDYPDELRFRTYEFHSSRFQYS